jgi:UDP-glucose 4-epimerase
VTVNALVAAARDATGEPIPVRHVDAKPGEMPAVVVDIGRARRLGYHPRVALGPGLGTVWGYFRGHSAVTAGRA